MPRCVDCIHFDVCYLSEIDNDIRDNGENPNCLHYVPTADVVPREEVETLKDNNEHLAVMLSEAKQDVAREIFAEINAIKKEYASGDIHGDEMYARLYMLEKKYTEEKT